MTMLQVSCSSESPRPLALERDATMEEPKSPKKTTMMTNNNQVSPLRNGRSKLKLSPTQRQRNSTGFRGNYRAEQQRAEIAEFAKDLSQLSVEDPSESEKAKAKKCSNDQITVNRILLDNALEEQNEEEEEEEEEEEDSEACQVRLNSSMTSVTKRRHSETPPQQQHQYGFMFDASEVSCAQPEPPRRPRPTRSQSLKLNGSQSLLLVDEDDDAEEKDQQQQAKEAPERLTPSRTQSLNSPKARDAGAKPTDRRKLMAQSRPQMPGRPVQFMKKAQSFRVPKRNSNKSLDNVFARMKNGDGNSSVSLDVDNNPENNSFSSFNFHKEPKGDNGAIIGKLAPIGKAPSDMQAVRRGSNLTASSIDSATVGSNNTEGLDAMMTIESIQRLGRHIPHAVMEEMINQVLEIKKRRDIAAGDGTDQPAFPGMTLELNVGGGEPEGADVSEDNGRGLKRSDSSDSLESMESMPFPPVPGGATPRDSIMSGRSTLSAKELASSCRSLADDAASVMSAAANSIHAAMELSKNLDDQLKDLEIQMGSDDLGDDHSTSSDEEEEEEEDNEQIEVTNESSTDDDNASTPAQRYFGGSSEQQARTMSISDETLKKGNYASMNSCGKTVDESESDSSNNNNNHLVVHQCSDVLDDDDSSIGSASASTNHLLIGDSDDESDGSSDFTGSDSSSECSSDSEDYEDFEAFSALPRMNSFRSTASNQAGKMMGRASLMVASNGDQEGGDQGVAKMRNGRLAARMQQNAESAQEDAENEVASFGSYSLENMTFGSTADRTNAAETMAATLRSTHHKSAIAFVDISGFTKLSQALPVESLSKTINDYYDKIVCVIDSYGGDCIKFAGDAVLVEWRDLSDQSGEEQGLPVALTAAVCAAKLVEECSDYEVYENRKYITTLNLHAALGYGEVTGVHLGDNDRMEYALLGDALRQMSVGMDAAALGEVAASPEVLKFMENHTEYVEVHEELGKRLHEMHEDDQPKVISSKVGGTLFSVKEGVSFAASKTGEERLEEMIENKCHDWSLNDLETLQKKVSRYLHSVVYADEFDGTDGDSFSAARRRSAGSSSGKRQHSEAELRDIFTVFILPVLNDIDLTGESAGDQETLELLNNMLFIVNSEVAHYKAHLLSFMLDDKGLVIIVNFGLKGSTFPNMIHERAIPCVSNIKTLLKTELDLDCKMGATVGNAYCGVVGGSARHQYSILGPSVNLAARLMCSKSNPGVLVDEEVKKRTGDRPYKALPPVKAKGYDNLVNIYSPDDSVRKAWKDIGKQFVARQEEMEYLVDTADNVRIERKAKFAFITAGFGLGKSCLMASAMNAVEENCELKGLSTHITRTVFTESDAFTPFSVVRPLFVDLLRKKQHKTSFGAVMSCMEGDEVNDMEETQLYVGLLKICLEAGIPLQYVEVLAGLIFTSRLSDIGTWSSRRSNMSEWNTIARYIVIAYLHGTREYDLVMLGLDDVAGLDEMSWKIMHKMHDHCKNLYVIATARNEFDLNITPDYWKALNEVGIASGNFRNLRLSWLDEEEIGLLASQRLGKPVSELDPSVAQMVYSQCKGSPQIACEIIDMLYKNDNGAGTGGSSNAKELLLNRLDSLPFLVRSYLNLGAILGLSFTAQDVIAVMEIYDEVPNEQKEMHAASVVSSLNEAVENGILKAESADIYCFTNALWRDVISEHIMEGLKEDFNKIILEVQAWTWTYGM